MNLSDALEIVRLTDVGLLRDHNEDAIASDATIGFVILADGMGGYNAGEIASEMAVLSITAELKESQLLPTSSSSLDFDLHRHNKLPIDVLMTDAVAHANSAIYEASQKYPHCAGMGTTLVLGLFANNKFMVGHIGDSRVYRLRHQMLMQVTEDHSLLQEQINAGMMTVEQARFSANRNLVTRALGIDRDVELELNELDVEIGDIYLLCSDGLTDLVGDMDIQAILNAYASNLTEAASVLVRMANDNGGRDNISVILIKVKDAFEDKNSWYDSILGWMR